MTTVNSVMIPFLGLILLGGILASGVVALPFATSGPTATVVQSKDCSASTQPCTWPLGGVSNTNDLVLAVVAGSTGPFWLSSGCKGTNNLGPTCVFATIIADSSTNGCAGTGIYGNIASTLQNDGTGVWGGGGEWSIYEISGVVGSASSTALGDAVSGTTIQLSSPVFVTAGALAVSIGCQYYDSTGVPTLSLTPSFNSGVSHSATFLNRIVVSEYTTAPIGSTPMPVTTTDSTHGWDYAAAVFPSNSGSSTTTITSTVTSTTTSLSTTTFTTSSITTVTLPGTTSTSTVTYTTTSTVQGQAGGGCFNLKSSQCVGIALMAAGVLGLIVVRKKPD